MLSQASPETQLPHGHPTFLPHIFQVYTTPWTIKSPTFLWLPKFRMPMATEVSKLPLSKKHSLPQDCWAVRGGDWAGMPDLVLPVVWSLWYGPFQDPWVGRGMPFLFRERRLFSLCCHIPFVPLFFSGLWALENSRGSRHSFRKLWTPKVCWEKHFLASWEEAVGFSHKNHSHTVDTNSEGSQGTVGSSHQTLVAYCPMSLSCPLYPAFLLGVCLVPQLTCLHLCGCCNKTLQSAIIKQCMYLSPTVLGRQVQE